MPKPKQENMAKVKEPSPLSKSEEELEKEIQEPDWTDDQRTYIRNLQKRLENARDTRDQEHEELDGMTPDQYVYQNERWGNTFIKAKKNKADVTFQSGTINTKMMAFLSSMQGLNLSPDITAYNKNDRIVANLGEGLEDIIDKGYEIANDEEKRMLREFEMLKHGTVYVEDLHVRRWEVKKHVTSKFTGKINEAKWTTKRIMNAGTIERNILPFLAVYLGDMKIYGDINDQPYIFTVEVKSYDWCKRIFGSWEMWPYVSRVKSSFSGVAGEQMEHNAWRLLDDKKDHVEIIRYQSNARHDDEFQIILNGIPMLPIGYPLSAVLGHGDYSIVQQNLAPIKHNFAIGKSFVFRNKNVVAMLDEMMRLALLKTQKSFAPPYLNTTGRVISSRVFMPGRISMGINQGDLVPLSDKDAEGVTNSEFAMIQELIKTVDRNTASQTFTGSKEQGANPTATQIIELQRQAKIMMGIMILSASLLEKKLAQLRLVNVLAHHFDPVDQTVESAKGVLRNRYKIVSRTRSIAGEGPGVRMIVPTDTMPTPQQLRTIEDEIGERTGVPTRINALNVPEIRQAGLIWHVGVTPKDKKSSEMSKIMFEGEVASARNMGLPISPTWLQERFAQVWEEDPNKMFDQGEAMMQPQAGQSPAFNVKGPQLNVGADATRSPIGAPTT